jgi:hypothetical protein
MRHGILKNVRYSAVRNRVRVDFWEKLYRVMCVSVLIYPPPPLLS